MLSAAKDLTNAAVRLTVGNSLAAKQDRAANAKRMAALVTLRAGDTRPLAKHDFIRVGEENGVEPWKLHGLFDQEVPGSGFDKDGRLIAVPELHQWTKRTAHAYDKLHPRFRQDAFIEPAKVSKDHPYRVYYGNDRATANEARWAEYIAPMAAIDFDRALESTSWGGFQFMGFNWKKLTNPSYASVFDVIQYLYTGHRAQLEIACRLLIADDGFEALRKGDWVSFAKVQNGKGRPVAYAAEVKAKADARRSMYA